MKPLTIRANPLIPVGKVFVMPDVTDPKIGFNFDTGLDGAERLLIACHPDDEQMVRDVIAVEQEQQKWSLDWQRIKQAFAAAREEDR